MAERTWEGETEPEEHADPLLAQNPSKSNPESREILSAPETEKATVLERRFSECPRKETPLRDSKREMRREEKEDI